MNISSISALSRERTYGPADKIVAANLGQVIHEGDAQQLEAIDCGRIALFGGVVSDVALAERNASVLCFGNPDAVLADQFSKIIVAGNPSVVTAANASSVVVLGQPNRVEARDSGRVMVVSLCPNYEPDSVACGSRGGVKIRRPSEGSGETCDRIGLILSELFMQKTDSPQYAKYGALLRQKFTEECIDD